METHYLFLLTNISAMTTTVFLLIAAVLLLSPAASALTCTSQTFPNNKKYDNCTDLPTLKAFLHWTYDAAAKPRPTLAVAFGAPPAKPGGYVAWGPNPTAEGMLGAQALVAFRGGDAGSPIVVKTYNISSFYLKEGNISYDVVEKSGLASGDLIWIFAKLALPEWPATINHVWQVGAAVDNGTPTKHALNPDNLNAKAKLNLSGKISGESPAPALAPAKSGVERIGGIRVWVYGILVIFGVMAYY